MYDMYKEARDKAWEVLIECKINKLPINLKKICDFYNIQVVSYSKFPLIKLLYKNHISDDGFSIKLNNQIFIIYNDKKNRGRIRFTIAHELGHILLGHNLDNIVFRNSENDDLTDPKETQANIFARDLLMPAIVLYRLNLYKTENIMKVCDISQQSAEIRSERMKVLRERKKFNTHPLERETKKLFENFINENKGKF